MKHYGLIGHPLSHSFSQRYFSEKFAREHLVDCSFTNYDLQSIDELRPIIQNDTSLYGLSVTIPYKQSVIDILDYQDETVRAIGACNSIQISNNILTGYNTDAIGFERSLLSNLKPIHRKALILGTGGAAKAIAYVLNKLNIDYLFVSRKADTASFISYSAVTSGMVQEYPLIINCSPAGMHPEIDKAPELPYHELSSSNFLFDLTYNPAETLFLKKGKEKGTIIQNGYDMLIFQAEASWKIWNEKAVVNS